MNRKLLKWITCAVVCLSYSLSYSYDLNNDGYEDIVVSSFYGSDSKVFYGSSTAGYNSYISLPTMYATGNTVADLNKDGYLDLIFCNSGNGATSNVDSYVYWGSETGYSTANVTFLPTLGASAVSAYDLNYDGYPDIIFSNNNDDYEPQTNSYIYWGGQNGFSASNKSELPTNGAKGNFLADLNKDGFIDIIFCNNNDGSGYLVNSYIYWGAESGFSSSNKTELVTQGAIDCSVKDMDKDGYYDIVFSNNFNNVSGAIDSYIYWGSASGYSSSDRTALATRYARANAIADIDNDGYDDIVFCNMKSGTNYYTKSYIYWGAATGFSNDTKTELQTFGADGVAVADVNGDGHLDVFFCNKTINGTSPQNLSYLYWGASTRSLGSKKFLSCGGGVGVTMGTNSAFGADYRFLISQNDQDLDGLPDQWEQRNGTDPYVNDAADDDDNDGLDNLGEFTNNTDPQISDTDNDGLNDGDELTVYNTIPVAEDTDGDGIIDGQEVNVYYTNPLSGDSDNDGMPDKWEIDNLLNPINNDAENDNDSDLMNNFLEYINQTDPHNSDTDNDGLLDGFEINYQETYSDSFESGNFTSLNWFAYYDNEAFWNIADSEYYQGSFSAYASQNEIEWSGDDQSFATLFFTGVVPRTAELSFYAKTGLLENEFFRFFVNQEKDNETQGDMNWTQYSKSLSSGNYTFSFVYIYVPDNDSDSFVALDQVSLTYYGLSPLVSDCDNDGLSDGEEKNIHNTSPFLPDSDFDGMNDKWEFDYGFNPLISDSETDTDNDGLLEYEEFQNNTNPLSADTDNDGVPDKFEVENSTDPLSDDAYLDLDNDGLTNGDEFFYGTEADNLDSDCDGIMDGLEVHTYGTDPLNVDSDNDGLSDNYELFVINSAINLTGSTSENLYPSIATNGDNYMLTWLNYDNDGDVAKILYNILDKRGNPLLENQVLTNYQSEGTLQSSVTTESGAYLDLNNPATGNYVKMACRFVAGEDSFCRDISLKLKKVGSPDGLLYISLNADGAGGVPGVEITQSAQITSNSISAEGEWIDFSLDSIQQLTNGNVYWIVLQTTNSAGSDCVAWEWLNNGALKNWSFYNGSSWSSYASYSVAALYKVFSTISPKIEYNEMIPDICSDGTNYFITWQNWHLVTGEGYYGIYGQLIDGSGNILASPTQINSMTYVENKSPVCISNGSHYLVSWQIYCPDNDTTNVHYHYLDLDGELLEEEYIVADWAQKPKLASDGEGFYMVWDELDNDDWTYIDVSSDNYYYLILKENDSVGYPGKLLGQIRNSDSERLVEDFQINENDNEQWTDPDSASNGSFYMVVWDSYQNDGNHWDIHAQMLDYAGKKLNNVFRLNQVTDLDQKSCAVSSIDNYFVSAFSSEVDNDSVSDILISYIQWGFGTNPLSVDTDNDGMPDGWELTNKLNALADDSDNDSDNDGLTNLEEFQYGSYAFRPDTDFDGFTDYEEIMVIGTSPVSIDTDNDGIPDKWEYDNSLSPLDNDSFFDYDNDGLKNIDEYMNNTNPYSSDTDNDGIPDKYEADYSTQPDQPDADGDVDNDGLTNYEEYLLGTYANDNDYDNDGMTDGYEVHKYFTDPKKIDTDNDGLDDYDELLFIDREIMVNDNTGVIHTDPAIASNGFNYLVAWRSTDIDGNVCLIKHKLLDVTGKPSSIEYVTAYLPAQNAVEYESATDSGSYLDLNNPNSGSYQQQAARFVAQRDFSCGKIDLKLIKKGSPVGNVFIGLYSDSPGSPGTEFVQSANVDAATISSEGEWVSFTLNEILELTEGSVYWIVLKSDYPAGTDCIGWEWQNTSPNWSFKTGDTWSNYASYSVAVGYRMYFTFSPLSENNHMRPHISSDGLNYLVTWQTWEYGEDGGYYKIMGQMVNYSGGFKGNPFQVNTATTTYQANPVSSTVGEDFVIFWEFYDEDNDSTDIHSRYVNSYYVELEDQEYIIKTEHENPVTTSGGGISYFISEEADNDNFNNVAAASNGNLFLELHEISNGSRQLQAQMFTSEKLPVTDPITLTDNSVYDWINADAASNNFNYLTVWDSQNSDGNGWGIKGQFLYNLGGLDNNALQINFNTAGNQKNCSVSSVGLEYLVVWEDDNDDAASSDIMVGFVKWGIGTDPLDPDTDNDGLPDYWEYINYTDLFSDDTGDDNDNDGLTNEQEYLNGSYAHIVDSDNDGLNDYDEVMVYNTNPVLMDTDNDGMTDKWEIDNILNPLIHDSEYDNDGDGFDNYSEFDYRTDPHNPDTDNDGLIDSQEAPLLSDRFKINTYTSDRQHYAVTANNGNDYLVVWESNLQDGNGGGIYAQRVTEKGVLEGDEFIVNTYTEDDQWNPVITAGNGSFLVAWASDQQDLSESGIYAQTLSASGGFIGTEIRMNTYTLNDQIVPVIASSGSTYLVCWNSDGQDTNSNGTYGQLLDYSGLKIGSEMLINEFVQDDQEYPSIASNGENYLAVWESNGQDGDNEGVFARIIDNEGSFVTSEFIVNDYTTSDQFSPCVTSNGKSYLIAWSSSGQDGSGTGVYASLFDNDGTEIKTEFKVNVYSTGSQIYPFISTDGENYLISWTSYSLTGEDSDVYARMVDNEGTFISPELIVNTKKSGVQKLLAVASMGLNYLIVWDSYGTQDNYGMYGQIFDRQGAKIGPQFQITDYPLGGYYTPSICSMNGDYFITFTFREEDNDGDMGVYAVIANTKYDPLNPDYDNDGLLDGEEVNIYNSNPASTDSDGDGILDGVEVNLHNTSPALYDTDNDGLSDYEEINDSLTDPINPDSDNDGMYDGWEIDNNFNPFVNDGSLDRDNDGLANNQEFLNGTNPDSSDTDNDGIPDKWEVDNNTKPVFDDSSDDPDNDGLDNTAEYANLTNPNLADTDVDGQNDSDEIFASTDPLDPDSVFELILSSDNFPADEISITWSVEPDMDYIIYWSDSLAPFAVWDDVDYPGLESDIIYDPVSSSSNWTDNGDDPEMNGLKPSQVDNRYYKIQVLPK